MAKMSKPRKKSHIVFGVLFAAIIFVAGATVILSCVAKDQYWNNSHLQDAILDLSEYDGSIAENDAGLDEIESVVHKCNEKAAPVRYMLSPFFEACNELVICYFQDVYGVDVTEKLNTLQIMEVTYPEDVSQMVGGGLFQRLPRQPVYDCGAS